MSKRKAIPLGVQLAAALAELSVYRGSPFAFRDMQAMTEKQFRSLFEVDHATLVANGGSDHFTNVTHRLIRDHRQKTKKDVAAVAKGKRLARKQGQHLTRMAEKLMSVNVTGGMGGGEPPEKPKHKWPSRKIPSRPFPKRGRPC
jgi:hypothetical protein